MGNLTLNDAVNRAVNWHPFYSRSHRQPLAQNEQIEVANRRYPQISAGVNNGYSTPTPITGIVPRWCCRYRKCFMTSAKWQAVLVPKTAGAQQQANVLLSIDTVAHETANAIVQTQSWQQMVDAAEEQLNALDNIINLSGSAAMKASLSDVVCKPKPESNPPAATGAVSGQSR